MGNGTFRGCFKGLIAGWLLLWPGSAVLGMEACRDGAVHLRGDWGRARFSVEIADDPVEQARGLMHRESLPQSAGMLFVYDTPRFASFWMRNTLIPLDMIFIDAAGRVSHVHHEAVPLDETPIEGGEGVQAVLEINGGLARRMGIGVGTEVRHPSFDPETAAWACGQAQD